MILVHEAVFSLLVPTFNVLKRLPEGSSLKWQCPGWKKAFRMPLAYLIRDLYSAFIQCVKVSYILTYEHVLSMLFR